MRPVTGQGTNRCPNMTYYMADLIQNKHDPTVSGCRHAGRHVVHEPGSDDTIRPGAADRPAGRAAGTESGRSRDAPRHGRDQGYWFAAWPPCRASAPSSWSPTGFVTLPEHATEKTEIMDRAIRANVLINSLDARGLYTDTARYHAPGHQLPHRRWCCTRWSARPTARRPTCWRNWLRAPAPRFFQNNNDLDAGLRAPGLGARILLPAGLLSAEPEDGRQFPRAEGDAQEPSRTSTPTRARATTRPSIWRTPPRPPSAKSKRRCSRARR